MTPPPLRGTTVLVTRPRQQAGAFCAMVERGGGRPLRFPLIEIRPLAVAAQAAAWRDVDGAIFVSANAARFGAAALHAARRDAAAAVRAIAIGAASAAQLKRQGLEPALVAPSPYTSEALLALPEMRRPAGRRYVVVKGVGGRGYLADTLRQRGACVRELEVYTRARPDIPNTPLTELMRAPHAVAAVASVTALRHLFEMASIDQARWLRERGVFLLPGPRVAAAAREMGIRPPPLLAENATDAAMFARLTAAMRPPIDC